MSKERAEYGYLVEGRISALRPMVFADCETVRKWRNLPRVREQYIYREEISVAQEEHYFREKVESGKTLHLIICDLRRNGKPVGCQVFNDIESYREDPETIPVEVGYFIGDEDALHTGIAREAMQMGIRFVLEEMGVQTVTGRILKRNTLSIESSKRCGMRVTNTLPAVECSDGTREDMVLVTIRQKDVQENMTALYGEDYWENEVRIRKELLPVPPYEKDERRTSCKK